MHEKTLGPAWGVGRPASLRCHQDALHSCLLVCCRLINLDGVVWKHELCCALIADVILRVVPPPQPVDSSERRQRCVWSSPSASDADVCQGLVIMGVQDLDGTHQPRPPRVGLMLTSPGPHVWASCSPAPGPM